LATVERAMNLPEEAKQHQDIAQGIVSGGGNPVTGSQPPPTLPPPLFPASGASSPAASDTAQGDPNFVDKRRQSAQQLIDEGDRIYNNGKGDRFGAIQKWTEAMQTAPGTQESQTAQGRIDVANSQNAVSPPGSSNLPGSFGNQGGE
jgi:hypothetical protein